MRTPNRLLLSGLLAGLSLVHHGSTERLGAYAKKRLLYCLRNCTPLDHLIASVLTTRCIALDHRLHRI